MGDIRIENYKKAVTKAFDRWEKKIEDCAKKLAPITAELDKLEASKTPSDDEKKRIAELKKQREAVAKGVDKASMELRRDRMLLEPPSEAPEKELLKLPDWMKGIIKQGGIPLGKGVTLVPDVSFDFKAKKLKSFGITVKWTW
jgi:hypothetical protein